MSKYLDLNKLISGELSVVEIDEAVSIDLGLSDVRTCSDAHFVGKVVDRSGYIELDGAVSLDYEAVCARCLTEVRGSFNYDVVYPVAVSLENEDNEDYIVLSGGKFDIEDFIYQIVVVNFPNKFLCREDCRGLCEKCGKNLNDGPCECLPDKDPRLAGLADFFK